MQDFPDRTACIVWFAGCNMRCPYCHNPELISGKAGRMGEEDVFAFLAGRVGLLDGVVFSGGEATLYPGLVDFALKVKQMGFLVKLDTNGSRPEVLEQLLSGGLVDFVALDYKAPQSRFSEITRAKRPWEAFHRSLELLAGGAHKVPFEVRTTIHSALLDLDDLQEIRGDLESLHCRAPWYIQNFMDADELGLGDLPENTWRADALSPLLDNPPMPVHLRNFG